MASLIWLRLSDGDSRLSRSILETSSASSSSLDLLSEPARIVARAQVVCPGPVVHTLGQLHKQNEVLRPQIERPVRSAKVKALAFAEFPFGIFASMTLSVSAWLDRRDESPLPGPPVPEQGLAAFGYLLKPRGRGFAKLFAEGLDRVVRLVTQCD